MEDGLVRWTICASTRLVYVLILVVMEDGLVQDDSRELEKAVDRS